jgi:hypothetical protein
MQTVLSRLHFYSISALKGIYLSVTHSFNLGLSALLKSFQRLYFLYMLCVFFFFFCGAKAQHDCTFLHLIDMFDISLHSLLKFPLSELKKEAAFIRMEHGKLINITSEAERRLKCRLSATIAGEIFSSCCLSICMLLLCSLGVAALPSRDL